jgi:hypothetical protein
MSDYLRLQKDTEGKTEKKHFSLYIDFGSLKITFSIIAGDLVLSIDNGRCYPLSMDNLKAKSGFI